MSEADVAILAVVGLSTAMGLLRGLARELMSLVVWVAAFVASLALGPPVAGMLGLDGTPGVAIGFVVVFVAALVAGAVVQRTLAKLVRSSGLGGLDRVLGSMFGALRGGLLTIVALIAIRPFVETSGWWLESTLVPVLLGFEREVLDLLGLGAALFSGISGSEPSSGP